VRAVERQLYGGRRLSDPEIAEVFVQAESLAGAAL
jgi:hypothetical protein